LRQLFKAAGFAAQVKLGQSVAIKLYMGELGNIRYLRPVFARNAVDIVREEGGRPFLFETVANYPGMRATRDKYIYSATCNGFIEATVNAPIVITDDDDDLREVIIKNRVDGYTLEQAMIPQVFLEADLAIILSHVKGHMLTSFGGAIKNLGMGCTASQTKAAQHTMNTPVLGKVEECDACGTCVKECPSGVLQIVEGRVQKITEDCKNCGTCMFFCPNECWELPPHAKGKLQIALAHAASAVYHGFGGKMLFVDFIQDIVPGCDCMPGSGEPVVQDVGIVCSWDPVALDRAALDLMDAAPRCDGKRGRQKDIFGHMYETDSLIQLRTAHKLGMGSLDYRLITI
jgi:uncharacterized Fe-S center protein